MLYYLLRFIFKLAAGFYFKKLQVNDRENIPEKGPVFFVSNHPSAFLDPIVIGTIVNRRLYFLAKGSLFNNALVARFLKALNLIPVFGNDESPGQGIKNKKIFSLCFDHLAKGGALLAFPEGVSKTERKLKKIQSGTARICLGAEAENDFKLNIKIVCVGLNFSDPHSFQSNVLVNIDQPIYLKDYQDLYKLDSFKAARQLTEEIQKRLETQLVVIQDATEDKLVADIESLYKSQLLNQLGYSSDKMLDDFHTTKMIRDSVHHFMQTEPERVEEFKLMVEKYHSDLERLKLNDQLIKGLFYSKADVRAGLSFFYFVLGLPVFIYGLIMSYLPYRLPLWTARFINDRPDYFGGIALTLGTFAFILFYSFQITLVQHFFVDWKITLLYALSLPLSGLFAYAYYKRLKRMLGRWKIFNLFTNKTQLITSILKQREEIIAALEKGKEDYLGLSTGDDIK